MAVAVDDTVAIVVFAVTFLDSTGVNCGIGIVAIFFAGAVRGDLGKVTIIVSVDAGFGTG